MNAKEYVGQILNEGAPSWVRRMPLADLESYGKDHPNAGKVTLDYIKREIFNRKGKLPSWVTDKRKESNGFKDSSGNKYSHYNVRVEPGATKEYVEKDGKKIDVFPAFTEFKGKKEIDHYRDDSGNKYDSKDVKKEEKDKVYVPKSSYDNKTGGDVDVEEVFKNVPNLNKHEKISLIKGIGKENLSKGVEVIEKDKLTKAPYSKGLIVVLNSDGEYMGKFEGAEVSGDFKNRAEAIKFGRKFIYVPATTDFWNSPESEISRNKLKKSNTDDELEHKATGNYGGNNSKEYYSKKLASFKQEKHGKDIDAKIQKINDNIKAKVQEEIQKKLDKVFSGDNYGDVGLIGSEIQKKLNAISELNYLHNQLKKNGKFDYSHQSERYNSYLKQFGF